ncbi:hypothetical protein [Agrobacterium sp. Azo12]|uniref:hypothetical protein n=1 Tax=Agrobacterium sp. Azo12 TaxID=3031129 RepID=UPI0023D7CE8A|nr:hypothetical protein [Agrobacterium sp. Azo12]MDO5897871.1 hypothetical protein [Agrobacterium sp. Azo12]
MTVFEYGKTHYPQVQDPIFTDTLIKGDCWKIELIKGVYELSFIAARHGGGSITHIVTKEEFEAVKEGKLGGWDLVKKYESIAYEKNR